MAPKETFDPFIEKIADAVSSRIREDRVLKALVGVKDRAPVVDKGPPAISRDRRSRNRSRIV